MILPNNMKRWKEFVLIGIIIFALIYSLYEISTTDEKLLNSTDYQMTVSICMETDVLLYLEDCKKFIPELLAQCDEIGHAAPICSKAELNEFLKTIDQRIALASVDLLGTGIISNESVKPYIITEKNKVVVIDPIFTGTAYSDNGFYDYWSGKCDESCLNIPICFDCDLNLDAIFGKSSRAILIFERLNYPIIKDYDFALNPEIIFEYETIIMLHNEYVTKEMYEVIIQHPKVMYLYPNALYNEVFLDDKNIYLIDTVHNYNHFDWEYENTEPYEFDRLCKNWKFREIPQGVQLLCYPEKSIVEDLSLIKYINDFVFSS